MSLALLQAMIILADTSVFITAVAPIVTGIIGAIFTYLGVRLNSRAKASDQIIAQQAQEYEGINLGQQFMKDALEEARVQIAGLREEMIGVKERSKKMEEDNAALAESNEEFKTKNKQLERKIKDLELQVSSLKGEQ